MARYSQVKGLSVITIAEGKKVGTVGDLAVDAQGRRVTWLRIQGGGSFDRTHRSVPVDAVTGVGTDIVTIRSEADLQAANDQPKGDNRAATGQSMVSHRVVTEDGRFLGEIQDFEFDPQSFEVQRFIVRQGNFLSANEVTIPAGQLVTAGADVVVVSRSVASPGGDGEERSAGNRASDTAARPGIGDRLGGLGRSRPQPRRPEGPDTEGRASSTPTERGTVTPAVPPPAQPAPAYRSPGGGERVSGQSNAPAAPEPPPVEEQYRPLEGRTGEGYRIPGGTDDPGSAIPPEAPDRPDDPDHPFTGSR
jgi:uncharacterized protein YrrD